MSDARILRQCTVVRDGLHNAFTDLIRWQGCYWVSYRKGTAHASADGVGALSVSADGHRFYEAAQVRLPGDGRDPKLVAMSPDRLAMIFPSWMQHVDPDRYGHQRHLQQYVTFSDDGFHWEKPTPIGEPNRWLWRVRKHDGRYWGLSYGLKRDATWENRITTLELLASDDMLQWDIVAQVGQDEQALGESDILFHPDGEAWIVSRNSNRPGWHDAWLAIAQPPYTDWRTTSLETVIHAPAILQHGEKIYVAGRRFSDREGDDTFPFLARASLGVWELTRTGVEPVLRIPAAGDCSYPGFIHGPNGEVFMSYYSQHAYIMGVIEHVYRPVPEEPYDTGDLLPQSDVYFAQLALP